MIDNQGEYQKLMSNLRKILKNQKITHAYIANELGMTESGVKKIFSSSDCSYLRFLKLCSLADVTIGELINYEEDSSDSHFISDQQNQFLAENWDVFCFYWKLVIERITWEYIKKTFRYSDRQFYKYMNILVEQCLISKNSEGKYILPPVYITKWPRNNDFKLKINEKFSKEIFHYANECYLNGKVELLDWMYYQCDYETFDLYIREVMELIYKYERISINNLKMNMDYLIWPIVFTSYKKSPVTKRDLF